MADWFGSGLQTLGSIGSSLVGGIFSANQARKNRAFQERMYNKQVEDNINFWKMQADFNLPSAQLQRIKDAGLNPLLMYSNGGVSNVATSAPASATAPSGSQASYQFENPFAGFGLLSSQQRQIESQIDLNKSAENKNVAEALESAERTIKTREESDKIRSEAEYNWRSMKDRLFLNVAERRLKEAFANTEEWKVNEIKKTIESVDKNMEWVDAQINNANRITDQQIRESETRIKNSIKETAQRIATLKAEERKAYADAWLARENARTTHDVRDSLVEKYKADMRKAIADGDAQELENIMNNYAFDKMPAPGSSNWKFQKWIENWVLPVTSSIGQILGPAAGAFVGAKLGK